MPEETEPKIENEDATLNEADDAVENAIKSIFGPDAEIAGLEQLDNELKKMINGIAQDMFAKKAENAEEPGQEEAGEETEESEDNVEQDIDNFAEEPSVDENKAGQDGLQSDGMKKDGGDKEDRGDGDKGDMGDRGDIGDKEMEDGYKNKDGDGEMGDKEMRDGEDSEEKEKTPETDKQQPEQGQKQAPEQPSDEHPQAGPKAGQPGQQKQTPEQPTDRQPAQENAQQEQGQQPQEQQEEQPEEKKQLERREKGGLTQGINALRNRGEIKKIDEQIKNLEKQRNPLNSAKRKLLAGLVPLEVAEKSLLANIFLLRIIQLAIYLLAIISAITIILFILGVSEIIWGAGAAMNLVITPLKLARAKLKQNIKKIKDEIKKIDEQLAATNKVAQKLAGERRNIINRSLIEGNEKQRQEEEQNTQDLET
ncbi:hypothetical protein HY932_02465 [Candidatus Falkowbacteria bacterium]|nr:hypothetical protein [Candidatus Falkowbacteria bacterium]